MRAGARPRFRRQDADPSEPYRGLQRHLTADRPLPPRSHIEACNAIFTPPAEEVTEARKIIAAFEKPENASRGAIQLDGRMVERLHADMARRTIAIADAIAAMAN